MNPVISFTRGLQLGLCLCLGLTVAPPAWAQDGDPPEEGGEEQPERIQPGGKMPFRPMPGMGGPQGMEGQGGPNGGPEGQGGPGGPGGQGGQGGPGGPGGPGGMEGGEGGLGPQTGPLVGSGGMQRPAAPEGGAPAAGGTGAAAATHVPCVQSKAKITMDFVDAPVSDVVKYMAEITCKNFIIKDDLSGKVTIISHQQVTVDEAYEAFLSALEVNGYTTVAVGKNTKVVPTGEAANTPLRVYQSGDALPQTDNFVTQIIQLENVSVADMGSVVKELAGSKVRVVTYVPTNTLIVTDSAFNIRRVSKIIAQLDVAAPKSKMEVVPLKHATAADVEKVLEEVYGVAGSTSSSSSSSSPAERNTKKKGKNAPAEAAGGSATNVGSEGAYISKIISDERTNSLIIMANEEALGDIKGLIATLDADIDPSSRSQIHVIYLENAKASDVASVLQDLSSSSSSTGGSRSSSSSSSSSRSRQQSSGSNNRSSSSGGSNRSGFGGGSSSGSRGGGMMPGGAPGDVPGGPPMGGFGGGLPGQTGSTGAVAAFDNGMRVTADENTNSLVIIAAPEDYRVIQSVISKLDIRRRQVFVEAVVLEVGSEDEFDFGIGYHGGLPDADGNMQLVSSQLNGSSFGATTDALSGLAMGIFGAETVDIPLFSSDGTSQLLTIPTFGIALNALASNSGVDILSNPSLLIVDNEDAKISVGRNVPFPVSSGRDNNNNPIVSYQREDVGIELTVTPQINESNTVTMELTLKVAEVEEDNSGLDVSTAGFITSERETENVVVVDDNQTIVIGGLIGRTSTKVETKIPILGDIPLIGALFKGKRDTERKTNLLIFLTPHVINDAADLEEVYRIKWAQREEFIRRFYGKSRDEQQQQLQEILSGSMTAIDKPSVYRDKKRPVEASSVIGGDYGSGSILPTTGTTAPPPTEPAPAPAEPAPAPVEPEPAPAGGN